MAEEEIKTLSINDMRRDAPASAQADAWKADEDSKILGHERAKFDGFGEYKYKIKERVEELMELTKKELPHIDVYLLWLCTVDYIIREELKIEIDEQKAVEFYKKFQEERETFLYDNVKIE